MKDLTPQKINDTLATKLMGWAPVGKFYVLELSQDPRRNRRVKISSWNPFGRDDHALMCLQEVIDREKFYPLIRCNIKHSPENPWSLELDPFSDPTGVLYYKRSGKSMAQAICNCLMEMIEKGIMIK